MAFGIYVTIFISIIAFQYESSFGGTGAYAAPPEQIILIVSGAAGDLAPKKIWPTLYRLKRDGHISKEIRLVGTDMADKVGSEQIFHEKLRVGAEVDGSEKTAFDEFLKTIKYFPADYTKSTAYEELNRQLENVGTEMKQGKGAVAKINRAFFFAIPPVAYAGTATNIHAHCMSKGGWTRVILEKPFGYDTRSFNTLKDSLQIFTEDQLYRIDHYLGKAMVRNLPIMPRSIITPKVQTVIEKMTTKPSTAVPEWNADKVELVMISFREDIGTFGRGGYFDESGIIRDIIQNHLLQVLALLAMDKPEKPEKDQDIIKRKIALLSAIRKVELKDVLLAQYTGKATGKVEETTSYADEKSLTDYRKKKGTDGVKSKTATYALMRIHIDNDQWRRVPIFIEAGKALSDRAVTIRIVYKKQGDSPKKELFIQVQPTEIIRLENMKEGKDSGWMRVEKSGAVVIPVCEESPTESESESENGKAAEPAAQHFTLHRSTTWREALTCYRGCKTVKGDDPDAYGQLFIDLIKGDHANFVSEGELVHAWRIFTPLLREIKKREEQPDFPLKMYTFGSTANELNKDFISRVMAEVHVDEYDDEDMKNPPAKAG